MGFLCPNAKLILFGGVLTLRNTNNSENILNSDKKSFAENPQKKDKDFFCALGDSFMLQNDYRVAIKEYLVSLMMDKNNIHALMGASKAYKNLKEYDKAIKHLKNARNIYGFDSEIYYELGLNYLLNADCENAQKNFIRTIKLSPENKNAQIELALTHEMQGEVEMARLVYNTIIEKFPSYIPAMTSLAGIHVENEEYEDAILLYKKIINVNKNYYRAYLGLGLCFDKLGKYSYAARNYKKYIAAKPNSSTARSLVGRICEIYSSKMNKKARPFILLSS